MLPHSNQFLLKLIFACLSSNGVGGSILKKYDLLVHIK